MRYQKKEVTIKISFKFIIYMVISIIFTASLLSFTNIINTGM